MSSDESGSDAGISTGQNSIDAARIASGLADVGVLGVTIAYVDNNGITRSRTVPVASLPSVARSGVGVSTLFAVFDSHDVITYGHDGLANASGDVRVLPILDRIVALAGQPRMAWVPGRRVTIDGSSWSYDDRATLERAVAQAAELGLTIKAGFELEFFLGRDDADGLTPAQRGPAYGPKAMLEVDEFVADVLHDLAANGVAIGQFHAEYGPGQMELSTGATDPISAADQQVLARQTIHAAARKHGLRASFAPLVSVDGVGNGLHIHISASRDGVNLLDGDLATGPGPEGRAWIAGMLEHLSALSAVTAPSVPSRIRLRPGYFAGAYAFWGIENREAPLRYIPTGPLLGPGHGNLELKTSDASHNPFLALAVMIAAGCDGVRRSLAAPDPISADPGTFDDAERERLGIVRLPLTAQDALDALMADSVVGQALGDDLLGAFAAVRRADIAWAEDREPSEIVASHRWIY